MAGIGGIYRVRQSAASLFHHHRPPTADRRRLDPGLERHAVRRCRRALSLTVTHALRPLKESAGPYFPPVAQVALLIVPLRPCPLTSVSVLPVPSLNP